ncbi:long-chain fatty acid--CoA ligase [Pacificimonas flava]|uniref:Long-chain fatty acid--CoA ligase n=2 Tax=Pacificimonas TaxID=1960290 RepID=A0A219B8P6_9SPHN|nr:MULTISPECIES: AMP-binding protein [Pacificimonas]MBZ6378587.1 AMP-binding protein [Pacificimonas aurantium]OWV34760.1 long-chain fatty acid--CoA ligase [Pacificimonas flava]
MDFSFGSVAARLGKGVHGDAPAIICGDAVTTWRDFDRRTDALASAMIAGGAQRGDKVAHLMRNSPAYLETCWAAFKARLVHVNVNYRYTGEELLYILDNSDATTLVYDASFAETIASLRPRLSKVKLFLQVGGSAPDFAADFETAASGEAGKLPDDHQPDDELFIYTGGTTGYPKGVIWRQGDLWQLLGGGAPMVGAAPAESHDALTAQARSMQEDGSVRRVLVLPPLMHGTGLLMGIYALALGGTTVICEGGGFEPEEALRLIETHRPNWAVIVGDAFARPLLKQLDAKGGDISSLQIMISSGTMWSPEVKAGLLRHNDGLMLMDSLGSSESLGMGVSVTAKENAGAPTRFEHDEDTIIVDEDLKPIPPGDERTGRIARGGLGPIGYYKDPEKSAATFLEIDGKRYTLAGDHARMETDGTFTLMGRGNQCINSGGEKIFPEEVEEALKTHAAIDDALVFGIPDETWGSAVSAIAEAHAPVDEDDLAAHVRSTLAAYKAPKRIVIVPRVPRAPNGKADYKTAKELFEEAG